MNPVAALADLLLHTTILFSATPPGIVMPDPESKNGLATGYSNDYCYLVYNVYKVHNSTSFSLFLATPACAIP